MPYVFLAIAVVSVAASGMLWKHQHDNSATHGTRVIAKTSAPSGTLAITQFRAPEIWHCSAGAPKTVILTWATTGAQSVSVTVGDASKPLLTGQPPSSQVSVPAPCAPESRKYTLTARAADGKEVTKTATTRGV
jgi:hypothetical protein